MQRFINIFLKMIKYPLLLLAVLATIPCGKALLAMITKAYTAQFLFIMILPMCGFLFLFFSVRGLNGSYFAIAEHELTHLFFGVLTFHKPTNLSVKAYEGGFVALKGPGNWLISLAPYFFPLFPFLMMIAYCFFPDSCIEDESFMQTFWIVFGLMTGYHFAGTVVAIHPKQTDFQKAGYVFTVFFLPWANIFFYGILFAFFFQKWQGVLNFLKLCGHYLF